MAKVIPSTFSDNVILPAIDLTNCVENINNTKKPATKTIYDTADISLPLLIFIASTNTKIVNTIAINKPHNIIFV